MTSPDALIRDEGTVLEGCARACRRHPERVALRFLGTDFSYGRLDQLVRRFAAGLGRLGVAPGDRVLLYLGNAPQWLVTYGGAQAAGAVPVPISPIYTPHELRYLLENAGSTVAVCADTNFGYVDRVLEGTPLRHVVVTGLADLLPWWKRALGRLLDRIPAGRVRRGADVHPFRRLLAEQPAPPPAASADPGRDLAHILYTGGTTGFPKGVPHTHAELLSGIVGIRETYRPALGDGHHTMVVPLPLFHMFTQDMVFALGLHLGNTVVLLPRPRPDAVLAAVEENKATLLIGVPALYRRLLDNPRLPFYDLRSLRHCWSAGDVLPAETAAAWRRTVGVPIQQVYGSTETVCVSLTPLGGDPPPASLGRVIPTREARVVDPETLEPAAPGEVGELLVGSSYSYGAGGYWRNPDETAAGFVSREGRLWCRTGDSVRVTGDGEIVFVDRRADMIKHKGYRVSASRVESVLQDHPAVLAAAVVGSPDPAVGERVKAFVILDADVRGVTAQDLIRHCRERLLRYEVPDYVEFRDMLPRSKVGKLLRRELKEEERRRAGG